MYVERDPFDVDLLAEISEVDQRYGLVKVRTCLEGVPFKHGYQDIRSYSLQIVPEIDAAAIEGEPPSMDHIPVVPFEIKDEYTVEGSYYTLPEEVIEELETQGYKVICGIDGRWATDPLQLDDGHVDLRNTEPVEEPVP